MNAKVADSVSLRKPYLVHVMHCSLVVTAHSVAASNLLRTKTGSNPTENILQYFFFDS